MTLWQPDPALIRRPAYLSLADQFARAIHDGRLANGARLPTHRRLADDLKLSVQTVSRAYEELIRRGLISGEVGRGSFVQTQRREPEPPYLPERLGEVIDLSILKPVCEPMHLEKLKQALAQLPEKQRLAIVMFTIDEMPQKQVAEALDCSVEAVKWHVFQGRKKLRELLKEHLEE